MTIQNKINPTIFPNLPANTKIVDESGNMTQEYSLFFQNLIMAMQTIFKNEGFVIPDQPSSNIILLTGDASKRNVLYDSTTDEFKGNIAGTWKTFTLT